MACLSLALLLALHAPLAGAKPAASRASQFYEDALQRFERKDFPGAVVQLKNVLQLDGKNLSAQVLLGRALLESGQLNAAEVALSEALRLGVDRAEVVVPLATARVMQGLSETVANDPRLAVEGLPRDAQYALLLVRAAAAVDLGELRSAMQAVQQARAIKPEDAGSFESEVAIRIRQDQHAEALAAAARVVELAPASAASHYLLGSAHHVVPDLAKAQAAYDKSLALEPQHLGALIARAGIHLDLGRLPEASQDIEMALKKSPNETRALYMRARIAERQGRSADARAAYTAVASQLDAIPAVFKRYRPRMLMLGGLAHLALGQREKAANYLESVVRAQPGNRASRVLASLHLSDRDPGAAIAVLGAFLRVHPGDPQAIQLLANAHLNAGDAATAVQVLEAALARRDDPRLRATLGLALVASARYGDALRELSSVNSGNPGHLGVGYALGSLLLEVGRTEDALRVAQRLAAANPKEASAVALLGQAKHLTGDRAGARTAFESALSMDAGFDVARIGMARLLMDQGDPAGATRQLNTVMARDDKHPDAILAMAELSERGGKLDQAEKWLRRSVELSGPRAPGPALRLADFHLRHGPLDKAREASVEASRKAHDAPLVMVMSARVSLASGDAATARPLLSRAAAAAGYSVPHLTHIASLQLQADSASGAAHSLDKALSERADHLPALALRARAHMRLGEFAPAEALVRRIQSLRPNVGESWALAGELAQARGQRDAALAAYRRAHELEKSTRSFMALFAATMGRDAAAGIRLAEQWLQKNSRDALVWRALADSQLIAGQLPQARRSYEKLRELGVRDADAFNNLAHVLLRLNDPGALAAAEQALALAPTAPHVLGTAGWTSFKAGQSDRALLLLRDARLRNPANADARFYLASVLAALGRHDEARTELNFALAADSRLTHRAEAEQLLARLN